MKRLLSLLSVSGWFVATGLVCAQAPSEPLAAAKPLSPVSEIACQFQTSVHPKVLGKPEVVSVWRMWRAEHEVEVHQVASKDGEVWSEDGAGGVMLARVFHQERSEVVFNAMELRILGRSPNWDRCRSLVSPQFLTESLKSVGKQVFCGKEVEAFVGEVGPEKWSVLWDAGDQLAVSVEIESPFQLSKTVLTERFPLESQPWERLRARGYERLGFTELGDNDTDPKMKRLMARMGIKCSHRGCGPVCLTPVSP